MTIGTGIAGMLAGIDGEIVVENSLGPGQVSGKVTVFTLCGKSGCDVVGITGCLVFGQVAAITILGKVVTIGMTFGTVQVLMGSL